MTEKVEATVAHDPVEHKPSKHAGGRRTGGDSTRQAILNAAVKLFAERGYEASSLRAITGAAGVDAAMVKHFFGGKQGLFNEAILQHADRMEAALDLDDVSLDEFPERFADVFLSLWETEPTASTFIALIRSAMENEENRTHLQTALQGRLLPVIKRIFRRDEPLDVIASDTNPIQLLGAHLIGVGIARYILRLEPIVALPREALRKDVADTVRRYLPTEE